MTGRAGRRVLVGAVVAGILISDTQTVSRGGGLEHTFTVNLKRCQ